MDQDTRSRVGKIGTKKRRGATSRSITESVKELDSEEAKEIKGGPRTILGPSRCGDASLPQIWVQFSDVEQEAILRLCPALESEVEIRNLGSDLSSIAISVTINAIHRIDSHQQPFKPKEKGAFMKLKLQTYAVIAIVAIMLAAPASASDSADAVAVGDWNGIAVQATITGARPGPTGVLDIAMVQAAVYDAVQAIEREFEPYYVEIKGASGSPVAATAKAAHDVLVNRFPAQTAFLDMTYVNYLASHGLALDDPGVAVGATAAAGIIALRACDGSFPNPPPPDFNGGTNPGDWRPTPPANAPMLAPWLGFVTPFTLTRPSQFRAQPPPALTSRQYARDYNEVKSLGRLDPSDRTTEQTDLAHFWSANYVVLWNQVLRDIAGAHVDNISDSARLFALTDMAIADAVITAWNSKIFYVFWRPITAIQEGNNDGNPRTAGDSTWLPLYVTPPYPDYTSGANNVTGAATKALELFFGRDRKTFSITTTNPGPTMMDTRTYHRFSDVAEEVVNARIYEGIHFRFADTAARKQGRQVARWAFENFLRPLDQNHDHDDDDDDHDHHDH